jgi:hypothetical protein
MSGTDLTYPVTAGNAGPDQAGDQLMAEILEALDSTRHFIDLEAYLRLRRLGGTHASIVDLFDRSCPYGYIDKGLRAGATSDEIASIGYPWERVGYYALVRQTGQSHTDALEAIALQNVKTSAYVDAIEAGAAHREIVEFATVSPLVRDYAKARTWGATHAQLMDGIALGITPSLQGLAAQRRLPYAELAAAVRDGANPLIYIENAPKLA